MVLYRIRLDASRPTTQASIYVKQGDSLTRQITFYLFQGSAPLSYPDPGITAAILAHKPDGTTVLNDCTVDHSSNVITYVISDQMMTAAGVVHAELRVYGPNGEILHSPKFDVHILDVLTTDAIVSSDDFSTLDGALSAVSSLGPLLTLWTNAVCSAASGPSAGATCTVYTDEPEHVEFTFQLPKGDKGDTGAAGADGAPGADGISPTITSTSITGGHRLTIVDAGGTHTVDVMDGQDGADGADGSPGTPGAAAGFGTPTATAEGLDAGEDPTVSVSASGLDTAKVFAFSFGIPKGDKGDTGSTGPTGNGIASISKTGTVGKVDTYTITYTNGSTSTFTVTNGEDGHGAGDMLKSVYDTNDDGIVDKATADASGNEITATYATKSQIKAYVTTVDYVNDEYVFSDTFADLYALWDAGYVLFANVDDYMMMILDTASSASLSFRTLIYGDDWTVNLLWLDDTDATVFEEYILQSQITASGLLKGDGAGGITAAVAGTDYIATNPVYIINATLSAGLFDNPTVTLDKTYAQMKAAFDSGKELLLIATYSGNAFVFRAVYVDTYIQFTQHGKTSSFSIEVDSADAVTTYAGRHQEQITASGMLKGDGNGGVSSATAGTDYQTPLTAGTDYQEPLTAGTDYVKPLTSTAKTSFPSASGGITTLEDNQRYAWSFGSSSRVLKGPDGATKRCGGTMNVTNTSSTGPTFTTGEIVAGEQPPFAKGLYVWECDNHVWRFTKATQY